MAEKNEADKLLVYRTEDGRLKLDVRFEEDTVLLTQEQIADLFGTSVQNIGQHIKNIYNEAELEQESTLKKIFKVVENRPNYGVLHYNLDLIISVGYRVNSVVATRFRQWATQTLKEYMVKGFAMDDKRLAEAGNTFAGRDYFDELLQRVRTIRTSEKLFYEKVKDYSRLQVMTTIRVRPGRRSFMPPFRISFITRSQGRRRRRLLWVGLTPKNHMPA